MESEGIMKTIHRLGWAGLLGLVLLTNGCIAIPPLISVKHEGEGNSANATNRRLDQIERRLDQIEKKLDEKR